MAEEEKTTIRRVKLVIITRIAGARERTVRRARIWIRTETSPGSLASPTPIFTVGMGQA
jgi:hypothetical protein